jgi:hypothetical protein
MGAVHNPNNHNPCRLKSQHQNPNKLLSQQVQNPNKYEIPTSYNPNRYEIPTKIHKLRQKLTFHILVININFLSSQFSLI